MNESVISTDIMRGNAYVWLGLQGDQKRALVCHADESLTVEQNIIALISLKSMLFHLIFSPCLRSDVGHMCGRTKCQLVGSQKAPASSA